MINLIRLIRSNDGPVDYHTSVDASEFYLLLNENCTINISTGSRNACLTPPCVIALSCQDKVSMHINSHGRKCMLRGLRVPERYVPDLNPRVYLGKRDARLHNSTILLCTSVLPGFYEVFSALLALPPPEQNTAGSLEYSYMLMYILMWFTRKADNSPALREISVAGKVYDIIRGEVGRQWTLGSVAERLYMSESTLKRKLKNEGSSFSKIYNDARMTYAKELLENNPSGLKIKNIARLCGFRNESYFVSCFKNAFGLTPSAYSRIAGFQ